MNIFTIETEADIEQVTEALNDVGIHCFIFQSNQDDEDEEV